MSCINQDSDLLFALKLINIDIYNEQDFEKLNGTIFNNYSPVPEVIPGVYTSPHIGFYPREKSYISYQDYSSHIKFAKTLYKWLCIIQSKDGKTNYYCELSQTQRCKVIEIYMSLYR